MKGRADSVWRDRLRMVLNNHRTQRSRGRDYADRARPPLGGSRAPIGATGHHGWMATLRPYRRDPAFSEYLPGSIRNDYELGVLTGAGGYPRVVATLNSFPLRLASQILLGPLKRKGLPSKATSLSF